MKSVHELTDKLIVQMPSISALEKTKLLVEVDKIIDKPYRDYRLEPNSYSVRYKATEATIYIFIKTSVVRDENIEYIEDVDITGDYKIKLRLFKNKLGDGGYYVITRYVNGIKNKFINRVFGH